ncbi:PHD finger protein 14 isoform X2 [Cimex lectularius]|uniref:PHD finger protein 14 n=1 Tax=Cimex lectularius TaxID=79782 RepID=A0A8I6TGA2_CIMLE|nr:PHD finger protein 14 isoform X2 [Cimex lectularius]
MDLPNKLFNYLVERDPNKRKVKPAQALFDFEDLGESSDDSDFRIEDHCDESDDSIDSNAIDSSSDDEKSEHSDSSEGSELVSAVESEKKDFHDVLSMSENAQQFNSKTALKIMICTVCLGDKSDATNEIIECDNCSVTVHEGCYGVQDNDSVCSTDSPCPTTPWFCDACKAGLDDPECELCPNGGGIFKETDVGKWVHLVCALYVPGVAFAEVDKLQNVTLFEMAYSKWGAKPCSLCPDQRFARTGVVVGCDAGMCKTHFHVTCGQREGLLAEAHSEEVEQADPFYAHCKLHTDKNLLRKRRRNWLALQMRTDEIKKTSKEDEELQRIKRRLSKYRTKYINSRIGKLQPWVPTQKMARLLTTSASACKALWRKAELSGADTEGWALRQSQVDALSDVHRRWYIQPAFTVEFIGYYLDRNVRILTMRKQLAELLEENAKLLEEQSVVEEKKDKILKDNTDEMNKNQQLKEELKKYHDLISLLCPNHKPPDLNLLGRPLLQPTPFTQVCSPKKPGSLPSQGMSANNLTVPSLNNSCGLCNGRQDQHLLAKCDTCYKHYHLGCLNPPLMRMPKKTKLMGWQCSECDKDSDSSGLEIVDPEAPRQLRKSGNGDSSFFSDRYDVKEVSSFEDVSKVMQLSEVNEGFRSGKKRKREKHHRYSPEPGNPRPHKHKHKHTKQQDEQRQSLKICFKSVPHPTGGSSYVATPSINLSPTKPVAAVSPTTVVIPGQVFRQVAKKKEEDPIMCVTCNMVGNASNLVRCDECLQGFHFACLDPPVKKSPKVRGYSWHCANCDPTESD